MKDVVTVNCSFNKVTKAEESGDGSIYRLPVEVFRGVELLKAAVVEDRDLIGYAEGLGLIMGDKNGGDGKRF